MASFWARRLCKAAEPGRLDPLLSLRTNARIKVNSPAQSHDLMRCSQTFYHFMAQRLRVAFALFRELDCRPGNHQHDRILAIDQPQLFKSVVERCGDAHDIPSAKHRRFPFQKGANWHSSNPITRPRMDNPTSQATRRKKTGPPVLPQSFSGLTPGAAGFLDLIQRRERLETQRALLGSQQPQFFGLTLDFLDCAGSTEETRYVLTRSLPLTRPSPAHLAAQRHRCAPRHARRRRA